MIFRQYGMSFQSVELNFDSKALNEVGFRRNHQRSIGVDAFRSEYELVETREIVAEAETGRRTPLGWPGKVLLSVSLLWSLFALVLFTLAIFSCYHVTLFTLH